MSEKPCDISELAIILQFIQDYFVCPWIEPSDDLFEGIPLDSLRYVELIIFLEKRFQIVIPGHLLQAKSLRTASAISEMIRQLKGTPR